MKGKRKICVVTAGRADYIRFKTAMEAIADHPDLELQLVVMGTHLLDRFGSTVQMIEKDGFPISARIFIMLEGDDPQIMTKSMGLGLIELSTAFSNLKPDVVVSLTDRFEALVTAVASATMNIPLAHLQGGEVTGTIDESFRHACTKLANWHFAASQDAAERIVKLGEPEHTVFMTGCPSIDLMQQIDILPREEMMSAVNGLTLEDFSIGAEEPFLLALQHPVTSEYSRSESIIEQTLLALDASGLKTIMLWPNVDTGGNRMVHRIRHYLMDHPGSNIHMYKHFPYELFVNLMYHCACMVGNSSASIRETPLLGTPVVDVGTREAGRERGSNTISVDYDAGQILDAIQTQLNAGRYPSESLFGSGDAGQLIAGHLARLDLEYLQKRITY